MSHRRKHVSQALLQDASPEVLAGQRILRVCEHRGSNILEVCVRWQGPAARPHSFTDSVGDDCPSCTPGGGRPGTADACAHAQ